MTEQHKTLRVYGCGGCGINNVYAYNDKRGDQNTAEMLLSYIDSSYSNLPENAEEEDCFIIDGVDGAGKVRNSKLYEKAVDALPQIMAEHEPGDLNVVVFSLSGGSGSVLGPLIVGNLLSNGHSVVCVVVGTYESYIATYNTYYTLNTLEKLSKKHQSPVVMLYAENNDNETRDNSDNVVRSAIACLGILANGKNQEIDRTDISNWLNFHKVTSVEPQLAQLEVFSGAQSEEDGNYVIKDPISVVSIYTDPNQEPTSLKPEYHSTVFLASPIDVSDQLHYVITIDNVPKIVSNVKKHLESFEKRKTARGSQESIFGDGDDNATDEGIVF